MKTRLIDSVIEIRREPSNLRAADVTLFDHEMKKALGPVDITSIKNAIVLKDVVYKSFRFYEKDCLVDRLSFKSKLKRLSLFFSHKSQNNKAIWIFDNWSNGYFHWFADALPRLWIARNHIDGHHVLLPDEYKQNRYAIDSLQILQIEYSFFNPLKKVSVKNLLLPGHVAPTGNFNSQVMQKLRDEFLKVCSEKKFFRKLYISRRKARNRRLVNETEFEQLLKEFGFETIISEDLSFLQQVQLFSEASILLGVHGSGLTNMLFMRKDSKVIELRIKDDNHNNCYFSLASAMMLDYYYIGCETTGSSNHTPDLSVDIKKARELLELINPI